TAETRPARPHRLADGTGHGDRDERAAGGLGEDLGGASPPSGTGTRSTASTGSDPADSRTDRSRQRRLARRDSP
ncbi:hypothetical protein NJ76_31195, partial [Rhodococcus sp. IITR03]